MDTYYKHIDNWATSLTRWVLAHRLIVVISALLLAFVMGSGGRFIEFATDYRVFFSKANPELQAFEDLQNTYTKNDNMLFLVKPKNGEVFDAATLDVVETLTERAWQIPYVLRVDSISNFQHTYAIEDDLIVEDLVKNAREKDAAYFSEKQTIATTEPLLRDQLVDKEGTVTGVNVVLQYPQLNVEEVPESVAVARQIKAELNEAYPDTNIYLTGVAMLNNAFSEAGLGDAGSLTPLMFLVILVMCGLVMRSITATVSVLIVIMFSTMVAMGFSGYVGIKQTPISMSAITVIMTLAVADGIHILISLRSAMRKGMEKHDAIVEAVRINFIPVAITSITTIVGFLALNFSDSPPYWHLGNITAVGIAAAWLYSVTLLPAMMSLLPYKPGVQTGEDRTQKWMAKLADQVIRHYKALLLILGGISLLLVAAIPTLSFNDLWIKYFDERVEFRRHSDEAQKHFGLYPVEYSIPAIGPGGISEPEYLQNIENYANFLREQPYVTHVYSFSDIIKRLNKNLHGDDQTYYRVPENRDLAAQYLLLYELSLPYGLDLNDRINIDKSATRMTATVAETPSSAAKAFFNDAAAWQKENWPEYMYSQPTSAAVMFTYISERNMRNMVLGTIIAISVIALIMMFALRSVKLGLLSFIPNGLPILTTFGAWALLFGEVGFSISTVASISIGIIVDDTVHFLSKYVRARDENNFSVEDSIRYAFKNVGLAIFVNTLILVAGFLVMTSSVFKMNVDLGIMTIFAIVFALVLDFLLLPALLLLGSKKTAVDTETQTQAA